MRKKAEKKQIIKENLCTLLLIDKKVSSVK